MFIGHYGASLAAKRFAPAIPLGVLFLGAQLLDVVFGAFVLAGIEQMRIVPGFTRVNPYDLVSMPYSHSLIGAVLWSALGALAVAGLARRAIPDAKKRVAAALVFALVVFSHFLLDAPLHTPDLPLGFDADSPKIGLGLWNQPDVSMAMELGALFAGGAAYLLSTVQLPGGARATQVTAAVLVVATLATPWLPPPPDSRVFALQALGAYVALAALAEWMDRRRVAIVGPVARRV